MAQLRFYWVSDRGYQRLAMLAIRENLKLVKLALTELEPHYATDYFVYFKSTNQVVTSVVVGKLELWHQRQFRFVTKVDVNVNISVVGSHFVNSLG
jgi:hypothetical protein